MKKRITRFALLLVLPAVATFAVVFNAYGRPVGKCPAIDPLASGVILADSEACNAFYICQEGIPYLFTCPDGLLFNHTLQLCDWPSYVDCNGTTMPGSMEVIVSYQCSGMIRYYTPTGEEMWIPTTFNLLGSLCFAGYEQGCKVNRPCVGGVPRY